MERDRTLSLSGDASSRLLTALDDALERMDDGSRGVCRTCAGPIQRQRLEVLPRAVLCAHCEQAEERR